jgi:hypothetical protein
MQRPNSASFVAVLQAVALAMPAGAPAAPQANAAAAPSVTLVDPATE